MPNTNRNPSSEKSRSRTLLIVAGLVILALIIIVGIAKNFDDLLSKSTPLPVNLHSSTQANYARDPVFMLIPPMNIELVIDAIIDQNQGETDISTRLTQVYESFLSPIYSITPRSTFTASPEPPEGSNPDTLTHEPGMPSETSPVFTETPTKTENPLVSSTPASPSNTVLPSNTPGSTGTTLSPTATESPLPPTAANTQIPPTAANTQIPPTATDTQIPPSATTSPCTSLTLNDFSVSQKKAISWYIQNGSTSTMTVSRISLTWPSANGPLDKIWLGSSKIWDQESSPPSVEISSFAGETDIPGTSRTIIEFSFKNQSVKTGFSINIRFSNGCQVSRSD